MMGVEFVKDKEHKTPFEKTDEIGRKIAEAAQKRGLIARPLGNILIMSPTLIMTEDQIDQTTDILRESIMDVQRGL